MASSKEQQTASESSGSERASDPGEQEALTAITRLKSDISKAGENWKLTVLEAIAEWPLAYENVAGERFDYLIGGEAFNWRLLAQRMIGGCDSIVPVEALWEWLSDPVLFAGFDEPDFMRAVGVDKFRAHLSYFYGVTVEQALLLAVEEEVTHRRVAAGRELSDRSLGQACETLYGNSREQLWEVFKLEARVPAARPGWRHRDEHSLGYEDAFTYWLFKLRMERSDPAKIASDTRKGLSKLERMRQNDNRRKTLRRSDELRVSTRKRRRSRAT